MEDAIKNRKGNLYNTDIIMSSKNPDHECSTELPDALAAAISSQNRNFWGVCAVRRPRRLARYVFFFRKTRMSSFLLHRLCYLINDTVTIGNAPFAGNYPRNICCCECAILTGRASFRCASSMYVPHPRRHTPQPYRRIARSRQCVGAACPPNHRGVQRFSSGSTARGDNRVSI